MKAKIIKATHEESWYTRHIGEEFEVEQAMVADEYVVLPRDPNGDFYILKDDCEIVGE